MLLRFIIILALVLMVDIYFFQSIRSISANWPEIRRIWTYRIYWGTTVFSVLFILFMVLTYREPLFSKYIYLYTACVIFVLLVAKIFGSLPLIIDDLIRLGKVILGFFNKGVATSNSTNGISRSTFLNYTALGFAAIPFVSMIYGMVKTAFDFTIRREKVVLPQLPAGFESLKIAQISDIHSGSFFSDSSFKRAVQMIMDEKPDVIFFTGDLVNDRSSEAERFIPIWKELSAPLGIFSTLGNHDYGDYITWDSAEEKSQNLERLKEIHKEMGWKLMMNEHQILERNGDKIGLIGVENWGGALRFPRKGDLKKATAGMPEVPVKILLSHDPSHWDLQIRPLYPDIDLTFAGHTHGFQFGIEIPGVIKWSPSQFIYKQWAGLYQEGKQFIYVNRGLGFLGFLGRVGIKPEITIMELSAKA